MFPKLLHYLFLLLLSSSSQLHYLLSNKVSFIHWHHLPPGTAGFCQVACLLTLAPLAFLCLITQIARAGVKGLGKICGKNKDIQGARQTQTIPT